jgi:hypothetical protein
MSLDWLGNIASSTIILSFCGMVFSYFVLTPLNNAITELQATIKDIRAEIKIAGEKRHALEIKVAEVDQSARSAHHRLDTLQEKILKE